MTVADRRRHRVIFNDDREALMHPQANTVEGFLEPRLKPLADSQVTTISFTTRMDVFADPPTPEFDTFFGNEAALIDAGHAPLAIVTDFAHAHGMEAFAHLRFNDAHDSFYPVTSRWKQAHPEFRVSNRGKQTDETIFEPAFPGSAITKLYAMALDFSHAQVRDRTFGLVEDVCEAVDVDGVELDFIRHPVLFKSTFEGRPISDAEIGLITSLIRRIRKRLDEIGERRGRAFLLAARVPDRIEQSLSIGLDLVTWMREGLLDMLVAGGYTPFNLPVAELARLAHSYDVPVYPCLNTGPVAGIADGRFLELARALAATWHEAGADGVYFWNLGSFFVRLFRDEAAWRKSCREWYACLYEVGDPAALDGKNKVYAAGEAALAPYVFVSSKPDLPVELKEGVTRQVPVTIADDPAGAAAGAVGVACELELVLTGATATTAPSVRLQHTDLAPVESARPEGAGQNCRVTYSVPPELLHRGRNVFEVTAGAGAQTDAQPQVLTRMLLHVRFAENGECR